MTDEVNVAKMEYAKKWCIDNNYDFVLITENYFRENLTQEMMVDWPNDIKRKINKGIFNETSQN